MASLSAGESLAYDDVSLHPAQVCARLSNSEILQTFFLPTFLTNLSKVQKQDVIAVIYDFLMLFKDTPTQMNVLQHDIRQHSSITFCRTFLVNLSSPTLMTS